MIEAPSAFTPSTNQRGTKRVLLHIGLHKTGTTSMQWIAARNAEALLERGVLYPQSGRPLDRVPYGHHLLPWSLNDHVRSPPFWPEGVVDLQSVWTQLRAEIDSSAADRVLISSEELDTLSEEEVFQAARWLEGYEVTVLCFLRRFDMFLQSMYANDVLYSGIDKDIFEYLDGMRTPADYSQIASRWKKAFGAERVLFLPYLGDLDAQWSVVPEILSLLGLDDDVIRRLTGSDIHKNKGAPWYLIETIVSLRRSKIPHGMVRDFIAEQVKALRKTATDRKLLSLAQQAEFAANHFDSLQAALTHPLKEEHARWFRGDDISTCVDQSPPHPPPHP